MGTTSLSIVILVCIAMLFVQITAGAYGVLIGKFAKKNHADPLVFSLVRDAFVIPVLFLAAYVAEKKLLLPKFKELFVFMLLGLFLMLSQVCYIIGIYYISTDIASMFQPISVIWVYLFSVMMRVEPIPNVKNIYDMMKVFGSLLAVIGAFITAYGHHLKSANNNKTRSFEIYGFLTLVFNTLSISAYLVVQKKYVFMKPSSRFKGFPVIVTAWSYVFCFIFVGIASIYYYNKPEKFSSVTNDTVYPLIYAIFVTSSLCFILGSWANTEVEPTLISAFWPLQVFFCVLLAYFVLGETLTVMEIIGGVLIVIALFAVLWSTYKRNLQINKYNHLNDSIQNDNVI